VETTTEARRPVLVNGKGRTRKRRTLDNLPPKVMNVKPDSPSAPPESPPPPVPEATDGKPDHSLVPTPRKKTLPAEELVAYWNSIPPRERDAWFMAYVYRDLPVCDPLQPLSPEELRQISARKKKAPAINCAKLSVALDPQNWLQEIKDKFGAGDYRIRLNDQHPSVAATVADCEINAGRDWNSHPPVVELDQVVLSDPRNEPYIRWAHLKGIRFPSEIQTPFDELQEEDDMANVSAVVESNKHLTDRVIEMSKEAQRPAAPTAPAPMEQANTRAVEVIADAATKAQKMMLDGIQAAQQSQTKAQDPAELRDGHGQLDNSAGQSQPTAPPRAHLSETAPSCRVRHDPLGNRLAPRGQLRPDIRTGASFGACTSAGLLGLARRPHRPARAVADHGGGRRHQAGRAKSRHARPSLSLFCFVECSRPDRLLGIWSRTQGPHL